MPNLVETVTNKKSVFFKYSVIDDETGQIIEQSDIPVGYVHGVPNQMFPKIERNLKGKKVGQSVKVTLEPSEHFGEHNPELQFSDSIDNVPAPYRIVGTEAEFKNEQGKSMKMLVTKVEDGIVTLDGNHPFAGKTVTYKVKITAISDATAEEIAMGHPVQDHPYL